MRSRGETGAQPEALAAAVPTVSEVSKLVGNDVTSAVEAHIKVAGEPAAEAQPAALAASDPAQDVPAPLVAPVGAAAISAAADELPAADVDAGSSSGAMPTADTGAASASGEAAQRPQQPQAGSSAAAAVPQPEASQRGGSKRKSKSKRKPQPAPSAAGSDAMPSPAPEITAGPAQTPISDADSSGGAGEPAGAVIPDVPPPGLDSDAAGNRAASSPAAPSDAPVRVAAAAPVVACDPAAEPWREGGGAEGVDPAAPLSSLSPPQLAALVQRLQGSLAARERQLLRQVQEMAGLQAASQALQERNEQLALRAAKVGASLRRTDTPRRRCWLAQVLCCALERAALLFTSEERHGITLSVGIPCCRCRSGTASRRHHLSGILFHFAAAGI